MPPMFRQTCVLAALTAALAGPSALAQKGSDAAIPTFAKKALQDHFKKNWELASVDPQATACRGDGEGSPSVVQADFNSDGVPDVAMAVKVGNDVRLVAVRSE